MKTGLLVMIPAAAAVLCLGTVYPALCWSLDSGDDALLEGSGDMITQERSVDDFTAIRGDCAFDLDVTVGERQKVTLTLDENLLEHITTEVHGDVLELGCDRGIRMRHSCRVEISVPRLEGITLNGAGDITIRGFDGGTFEYVLNGAGDLEAQGTLDELELALHGAGSVDTRELRASEVLVRLAGACTARVFAVESFTGRLSGVGKIEYWGDPERVSESVSGIGKIRAR